MSILWDNIAVFIEERVLPAFVVVCVVILIAGLIGLLGPHDR